MPASDGADEDGDGLCDIGDNCVAAFNPNQLDTDSDLQGDACDEDDDNDGSLDVDDIDSPLDPRSCADADGDDCDDCANLVDGFGPEIDATPGDDGLDTDGDGLCDVGDDDDDGDGVIDELDGDPLDPLVCLDGDEDGCDDCSVQGAPTTADDGDDADGDTICDVGDNCLDDPNPQQLDTDGDGLGDACDRDRDNDGVNDDDGDADPLDPHACIDGDQDGCDDCTEGVDQFGELSDVSPGNDGLDTDSDGVCNVGDDDDDGDTVVDDDDRDPLEPTVCRDEDGDGCDDCTQGAGPNTFTDGLDGDSDGVCDIGDNCFELSNADQADADFDGVGDVCDVACEPADVETCGDGIDNDCDDTTDEGCNGCRLGVLVRPGWKCAPATGPGGYVMGSPGAECPGAGCIDPRCALAEGCPGAESNREQIGSSERQHLVRLTHAMLVRRTLVTQEEWQALVGSNPAFFGGCPQCPVERVAWPEMLRWLNLKSEQDGLTPCYDLDGCQGLPSFGEGCEEQVGSCNSGYLCGDVTPPSADCDGYRLPTDAEYEYLQRGGTFTAWYTGSDNTPSAQVGWARENAGNRTHVVADEENLPFVCNPWGLCDMAGNVHAAVFDKSPSGHDQANLPSIDPVALVGNRADHRAIRTASWNRPGYRLRSSYRHTGGRDSRSNERGFRYLRYLRCDDSDGDLYGQGVGCFAEDCAPDDGAVNDGEGNCPPL